MPTRHPPLFWLLARRFLKGPKEEGYIGVSVLVSGIGMALVMAAFVVASSIQQGFSDQLAEKIADVERLLGATEHLGLATFRSNASWEEVHRWPQQAAQALHDPALAQDTLQALDGIVLVPDEPMNLTAPTNPQHPGLLHPSTMARALTAPFGCPEAPQGPLSVLDGASWGTPMPAFSLWLSQPAAEALGVSANQTVLAIVGAPKPSPLGSVPRVRRFRVAGILQQDKPSWQKVWLSEADCVRLLRATEGEGRTIWTWQSGRPITSLQEQSERSAAIQGWLAQQGHLGQQWAGDLHEGDIKNLKALIGVQKWITWMVLCIVLTMGGYQLVSGLLLLVREKRDDIAVLRATGLSERVIWAVFLTQGLLIGLVALAVGIALGCFIEAHLVQGLTWVAHRFDLPSDLREAAKNIRVRLDMLSIALASGMGLLACALAAWYPAHRAARTSPLLVFREGAGA